MSNEYLFRFKMAESPLCFKCKTVENYCHLFYECHYSRIFWIKFSKFCVNIGINMKNVDVDYKDIVIGRQGGNGHNHISFFNVLINLATYTIFKQKRKSNFKEIFEIFIEELKWRANIKKGVFWKKCRKKIEELN